MKIQADQKRQEEEVNRKQIEQKIKYLKKVLAEKDEEIAKLR